MQHRKCTTPCSTFDGSRTDTKPTLCGSSPRGLGTTEGDRGLGTTEGDAPNFALLTGIETGVPSVDQIQSQIKANTLPIFRAPVDSGCTATCTDTLARLINVRPCDEDFRAANGSLSHIARLPAAQASELLHRR